MNNPPQIKRTGEMATVGAVHQRWGTRPIGLCSCGKRVVSLQNDDGKWFLADVREYRSGRGFYYIGKFVHRPHK